MVLVAQGDALSRSQRQSWIAVQVVSLVIVGWVIVPRLRAGISALRGFSPREAAKDMGVALLDGSRSLLAGILGYVIVLGIPIALGVGIWWIKEQYFDSADTLTQKADKCWEAAKTDSSRLGECAKLTTRAEALHKREEAEQFCKDKGLRFKGTIGDQTECEP